MASQSFMSFRPIGENLVAIDMKQEGIWYAKQQMTERRGRIYSLRPAMLKVAAFVRYELKRDWDSLGAYSGNKWAENASPTYVAWKQRRYPASRGRVMHLSQNLRNAIIQQNHPSHVEAVSDFGVTIGIRDGSKASIVAGALREGKIGGFRGTQSIPQRNPMQTRRIKTKQGIALILSQYIESGFLPPSEHM